MRNNIIYAGADELIYEIREIVEVANQIEKTGLKVSWENIGDPVAKGEIVPQWIRDIVAQTVKNDNSSFSYSPTKGLLATREFIAKKRNSEGGVKITADDILFFNGLGDAISTIYSYLNENTRVIGPNPAYPTHSSAEAAHAGSHHLTYRLDPNKNWEPDLEDLRGQLIKHPEITGILIVNPGNPTGSIYSKEAIEKIVALAKEFDLFIIADEIYLNLCYGEYTYTSLASVIGKVPGISMRGISKEFPWPGARCGWIEFYNRGRDPMFERYSKTIVDAKMLEVCSTTLPQKTLPKIMSDSRYQGHLKKRNSTYMEKSKIAYEIFSKIQELKVNKTSGAFYMTIIFNEGSLNQGQFLKPANKLAGEIVKPFLNTPKLDKRFIYNLLAATGICAVPLSSGFNSDLYGFRITLLEPDIKRFEEIMLTIAKAIKGYLAS